jgi:homoserine/homoserine lactone efflux protein
VTLETWLLFCATEAVLCLTPGPAVLLVVSTALARSASDGLRTSGGILAANTGYFALSATSLGAVLVASWELFVWVQWAGAAYLVWLGARAIVASLRRARATATALPPAPPQRVGPFTRGLVTQGANPKSLLFFSAILPQFVDPHRALALQVLILGASSIAIEFGVLSFYVLTVRKARGFARSPAFAGRLEAVGGAFLVAAGLRLATLRRE